MGSCEVPGSGKDNIVIKSRATTCKRNILASQSHANLDAMALRRGASRSQLQKRPRKGFADATALRRGASRSQLPKRPRKGLVDATALCRGASRSQLPKRPQKVFAEPHVS